MKFPRNCVHSLEYYKSVLLVLIDGLTAGHRQITIANTLNDAGILSSTGEDWSTDMVKSVLKRLRQKTGPHYKAMLELCFSGSMNQEQCKPLLQSM